MSDFNKILANASKGSSSKEKGYLSDVIKSQNAELARMEYYLKQAGVPDVKGLIKAEKAANAQELLDVSAFYAQPGEQTGLRATGAGTYDASSGWGKDIQDSFARTIAFRDQYNIPQYGGFDAGKVEGSSGVSFEQIDRFLGSQNQDPYYSLKDESNHPIQRMLSQIYSTNNTPVSADQLGNLKAESKYPGIYSTSFKGTSGGGDNNYKTYYKKNADGTYSYVASGGGWMGNDDDNDGVLGTVLTIASIIPSPIQPWAMAANAAYNASQGNVIGAVLSALGANAQFAGVSVGSDAMAMATEMANQGASISEIAQAVEGFAGVNSIAATTTAVASTVAAQVGGIYDAISGTIKDTAGNIIGTVEEVAQGLDGGLANVGGNMSAEELAAQYMREGMSMTDAWELAQQMTTTGNLPYDQTLNTTTGTGTLGSGTYGLTGSAGNYGLNLNDIIQLDPAVYNALNTGTFDPTTIPNLGGDSASWLDKAWKLAKDLLPGGSNADIGRLVAQLVGNNQAHNAVEDTINKYADRLEGLSPISNAERDQLGDIGMERFGRDYLGEGRDKWLYNEYGQRGAQADNMAGMLSQLYTDPTQMGVFNAINDLATANTMRMQGARGTLQSGSTSNDYRNAAIKSMLELAQPMNQSLSTMYSGQQVPVQAFNALSGANSQAAQQGAAAINAASGTQSNLASFMPTAFEASLRANPTLAGNQAMFGTAGRNSAQEPSTLQQLGQGINVAKTGWDFLDSIFN